MLLGGCGRDQPPLAGISVSSSEEEHNPAVQLDFGYVTLDSSTRNLQPNSGCSDGCG
jgi:hypothetical protein